MFKPGDLLDKCSLNVAQLNSVFSFLRTSYKNANDDMRHRCNLVHNIYLNYSPPASWCSTPERS